MKRVVLSIIFLVTFLALFSQGSYREFHKQSTMVNKTGMYVLGGWAIANMAAGGVGWARTSGSELYFHQMNLFWNTVNLGIAGYSLYSMAQVNPWMLSSQEIMNEHIRYENLFLINAGLDVLYVGAGFLLRHLSRISIKRPDQLLGYGNSVILQGSFLFLFDAVMYSIQHVRQLKFVGDLEFKMLGNANLISYTYYF